MDTRRFAVAAAAYVLITLVVAAGWHLAIFKDVYDQLGIFTRKEPLIHLGLISMVLQGLVVAYLYPFARRDRGGVTEGLRFGLLMGVFMGSNAVFAEAGKNEVSSLSTWLTLESAYYLLQFSIVGMVVGLIFGRRPASSQ